MSVARRKIIIASSSKVATRTTEPIDWTPFTFATTECVYCGVEGTQAEHVVPRSTGGLWTVPSCGPCNMSKGARTPEAWIVALQLRAIRVWDGRYSAPKPPSIPPGPMNPYQREAWQKWEEAKVKEERSAERFLTILNRLPRLIASGIVNPDVLVDLADQKRRALASATNEAVAKVRERVAATSRDCGHLTGLVRSVKTLAEERP